MSKKCKGYGKECLPDNLKDKKHDDWIWPFSLIPRAWNAFCGCGPVWLSEHKKPVPLPGHSSYHWKDKNGSWRPYYAVTFDWWKLYGFHIRFLFRWDDTDFYYNLLPVSAGFEYDEDGNPV